MLVRVIISLLLLSGLYLQYKYWFSDVGYFRDRALGLGEDNHRLLNAVYAGRCPT